MLQLKKKKNSLLLKKGKCADTQDTPYPDGPDISPQG